MPASLYLDTARTIGQRLARQALWDGAHCTWEVVTPDLGAREKRAVRRPADGALYQGSAGIAWFLAELHRRSGDREAGRAARGGIERALALGEQLPPTAFGFHSGRVGMAWVAARLARIFDHRAYAEAARDLLAPLAGQEHLDPGLDVIGGAAGAIPALLELAGSLAASELVRIARRLGDHLLERAHREPGGWAWKTAGPGAVRYLNGLAHGASGIGLALLELARATGDGRYRFAAEMAFLYERRSFDRGRSNWPDLRHREIGDAIAQNRLDDLRRTVRDKSLRPYVRDFMTAWCHGSPGIGLARLRAWEITGQDLYRQEADAAWRSTRESLTDERLSTDNYSLCHGIAGHCELPLRAAEILDLSADTSTRTEVVERAAVYGAQTYESVGRPWPCGTLGAVSDPSLMLGEAGIGLYYLRLADPETPSVLLLQPSASSDPPALDAAGYERLAQESMDESFGLTWQAFSHLEPPGPDKLTLRLGITPLDRTPAERASEILAAFVERHDEPRRSQLVDAFLEERCRFEATLELTDFTAAYLSGLARVAWEEVDAERATFSLVPGGRLCALSFDWRSWIGAGAEAPPGDAAVYLFFFPENDTIRQQRVGPLAALILESIATPAPLDGIVQEVAAAFGGSATVDADGLTAKVLMQLEALYRAGFVEAS